MMHARLINGRSRVFFSIKFFFRTLINKIVYQIEAESRDRKNLDRGKVLATAGILGPTSITSQSKYFYTF